MNTDAVNAINKLRQRGEQIYIVPQNLIEFWNVHTRPLERNGLGRTAAEAEVEVNCLKALFPLLLNPSAIYGEWERLVIFRGAIGVNIGCRVSIDCFIECFASPVTA